jgi:8-oxo-dGTP pyrophosphatase MutT (NUDIX family)
MSDTHHLFATVLLIKRNAVFLLKRSDDALRFPHHYISIGGMMHAGEGTMECIIREACQEAGIKFL